MVLTGDWVAWSSYVASALVFTAFFMKAILPLRLVAMAANVAFIVYASMAQLPAVLILHVSLLPLNLLRVIQHIRLIAQVRRVANGPPNIHDLLPLMEKSQHAAGSTLFQAGDVAERLYFLAEGRVSFPEVNSEIGAGTLFGEIALFLDDPRRTASARCQDDCTIFTLSKDRVSELVLVNPVFGLFLTKLIATRLQTNVDALRQQANPSA